jgi:hypothetical protein
MGDLVAANWFASAGNGGATFLEAQAASMAIQIGSSNV